MAAVRDPLERDAVQRVLAREHERAGGDEARLAAIRPQLDAARAAGRSTSDLYPKDVYLAVSPGMGRFLYLAARSIGAKRIVEFGASFGLSTIYLAAAAKETGGRVITTELEAAKVARARANLEEAELADRVEIRPGDALETLRSLEGPVDLLFLDGWKEAYLPVLELVRPALREGAMILADNVFTFPAELKPYVEEVTRPEGAFRSMTVPFSSGLEFSILAEQPDTQRNWPPGETGRLEGIARRSAKRAPMELLPRARVTAQGGIEGDSRGRFRDRAVTVLSTAGWAAALADLGAPAELDWTARRANLLVDGVRLPSAKGGVLLVGQAILEVTGRNGPCSRMDEQRPGLRKALAPGWRGGVTCRVLEEGELAAGDSARVLLRPAEEKLPGLPG